MTLTDFPKLEQYIYETTNGTISPENYETLGKWLMECAAMRTSSKKITSILGFERVAEERQSGVLECLTKIKEGDYEKFDSPLHAFNWAKKICGQSAVRAAFPTIKSAPKGWILKNTKTFTESMPTAVETLVYGEHLMSPYRTMSTNGKK